MMNSNEEEIVEPTHTILLPEQVFYVSFFPYEWSQNLLLVGMLNKVAIGFAQFEEINDELEVPFELWMMREFHTGTRTHALCWSPDTSISDNPKVVIFCVASADFKMRIMHSDLVKSHSISLLSGHKDYVNGVNWQSDGKYIASASDDHTVKIWRTKILCGASCVTTFKLTSPGMDVCWHPRESGKLIVAEKIGLIRVYNIHSQQAILSIDAGSVPLMSAHWAPSNHLRLTAVAGGELFVWNLDRPSRPIENRSLHEDGGHFVRFSKISDQLLASVGRPNNTFKVTHTDTKLPQITYPIGHFGGLTWHYTLPYVCVANDRQLYFWKVLME